MPFELIMLLGFLGVVLLSLLPVTPAKVAGEGFRGRKRHSGGEQQGSVRYGRPARRLTKRCDPTHSGSERRAR